MFSRQIFKLHITLTVENEHNKYMKINKMQSQTIFKTSYVTRQVNRAVYLTKTMLFHSITCTSDTYEGCSVWERENIM